jgi:hypothetical protein
MVSSRGNGTLIGAGWHAQKIQTDPLPNSDRGTLGEQILVFPCAVHVTWTRRHTTTQDGKALILLAFDSIAHGPASRAILVHAKAR